MSKARNLSKLGVDTSGLVDASTAIADSSITSAKIAIGAVTSDDIADNAIINGKIPANSIALSKIARTGTAGQVLMSGGAGADPSYQALPAGGVTSLTAGNGITVSGATGAVTISQDIYTGSTNTNTSYPIGSYLFVSDQNSNNPLNNTTVTVYNSSGVWYTFNTGTAVAGTWKTRGRDTNTYNSFFLMQRIA